MATFVGVRVDGVTHVYRLDPPDCTRLTHYLPPGRPSKGGFEWGYSGAGPAELAFCLLADVTGDTAVAELLYQRFKFDVVRLLPRAGWVIETDFVEQWLVGQIAGCQLTAELFEARMEDRKCR